MAEMLLIYKGTIGSILSHYIQSQFDVTVHEYEIEPEDLLSDQPSDVRLSVIVSQEFPTKLFPAVRQRTGGSPIVWLCQDRNNRICPDKLVVKHFCDGVDEWFLFNKILDQYLADYKK
jgi:hypothetical protein